MKELVVALVGNEVVQQALGYVLAIGVYALGSWLWKKMRGRLPAELVDRMWDSYLHDVAGWVWREVRARLDSGEVLTAGWKARVVLEAMRQLEREWNKFENEPLSKAQVEAAQAELVETVEKARHG